MSTSASVLLPRAWSKEAHRSVLHALSVAATALTRAWSRAASSRRGQQAESERLRTEIALLIEELDLKDARWRRVPAQRRPHYGTVQRMRILELRALRGWWRAGAGLALVVTRHEGRTHLPIVALRRTG